MSIQARHTLHRISALLCALLFLFAPHAGAEYWDGVTDRPVVCRDDRQGCQVLQMVMMGSLATLDVKDSLSVRVFSAAFPRLTALQDEDFTHFADEFGIDANALEQRYYIALGNCLWADILLTPKMEQPAATEARRVLKLFLDPESEPNGREQMAIIRVSATDETLATLAESAGLPLGFVEYLIYTDHWTELYTQNALLP